MIKGSEELRKICSECERHLALSQKRCPFRSISNEYCDEYENVKKELQKPQELYNKIKQKRDNALNDLERTDKIIKELEKKKNDPRRLPELLKAKTLTNQAQAYHDVVCLMESMFEMEV